MHIPPLLCIEVLSKGDSLAELQERVDGYQAMGVENIWAIDPWNRRGYVGTVNGFVRPSEDVFTIPEPPSASRWTMSSPSFDEETQQP